MTAEYTPEQTPPRQCPECGGLTGHTADCPNRVDDRAVVVGEALAAHSEQYASSFFFIHCGCGEGFHSAIQHRAHVAAAILAALDGASASGAPYGFGLLRSATDTDLTPIAGGLDPDVDVVATPPGAPS